MTGSVLRWTGAALASLAALGAASIGLALALRSDALGMLAFWLGLPAQLALGAAGEGALRAVEPLMTPGHPPALSPLGFLVLYGIPAALCLGLGFFLKPRA